jgi:hypothetical protein
MELLIELVLVRTWSADVVVNNTDFRVIEKESIPMVKKENQSPETHRNRNARIGTRRAPMLKAFTSDDDMLKEAKDILRRRQRILRFEQQDWPEDKAESYRQDAKTQSREWHTTFRSAQSTSPICSLGRRMRLNRIECEVLATLVLDHLSLLLIKKIETCADVVSIVSAASHNPLHVLRTLSAGGRLVQSGLVEHEDEDDELSNRVISVSPKVTELLSLGDDNGFQATSERELYDHLAKLSHVLMQKSDFLGHQQHAAYSHNILRKWTRLAVKHFRELDQTLRLNKHWNLSKLRAEVNADAGWVMVIALLGKELGHIESQEPLFTGAGLARAASIGPWEMSSRLRLLSPSGELLSKELVQPCDGTGELLSDNPADLSDTEYELTEKSMQMLDLEKRTIKRSGKDYAVRPAAVRMEQLVLPSPVRKALRLAEVHVQNASHLLDDWGLGKMIGNASIESAYAEHDIGWIILDGEPQEVRLSGGPLVELKRRNQLPAPLH